MRRDEGFEGGDALEERDGLDKRVDAALRRYAEAPQFSEPRVALARVRALAEQEPRRRWAWMWAAAVSAAAMIAVAVIWMGWGGARGTSRPVQVAKSAPLKPSESAARNGTTEVVPFQNVGRPSMSAESQGGPRQNAGPSTALRRKEPRRSSAQDDRVVGMTEAASAQHGNGFVTAQARRLPKQEVFPTPEPLSAQERAMVAFATQAPPEVREQVIEAQKHWGDPIEVAAIPIEALDTSSAEPQSKGKDFP